MWIALRLLPSLRAFSDALSMLLLLFERQTPIVTLQGTAKPAGWVFDAMPFLCVPKNREFFQHGVRAEELSESPRAFLVDAVPFASMEIFSFFLVSSSQGRLDFLAHARARVFSVTIYGCCCCCLCRSLCCSLFARARGEAISPCSVWLRGLFFHVAILAASIRPFWPHAFDALTFCRIFFNRIGRKVL